MRAWLAVVAIACACGNGKTSTATSAAVGSNAAPVIVELAPSGWGSAVAAIADPSKVTVLGCDASLALSPPAGSGSNTRVGLPGLERFTQLQQLCIEGAGLTAWPDAIAKLPLKRLDFRHNTPKLDLSHASLPPTLESLLLADAVSALPHLAALPHLKQVFVQSNGLTAMPSEIWDAPALAQVTISQEDRIRTLPGVEHAKSLRSLGMPPRLDADEVARVTELAAKQTITLENGDTTQTLAAALAEPTTAYRVLITTSDPALAKLKPGTLPHELFTLTGLRELTITDMPLTSLPADLGKLVNLTSLTINGTRITALPPELGKLVKLQTLDVGSNRLASLPAELTRLVALEHVWLDDNAITALPEDLGKLVNLRELVLPRNRVAALPASIASMTKLETLDADGNRIASVPDLSAITTLNTLLLWDNAIATVPDGFGASITTLDLRRNPLDSRSSVPQRPHGFELEENGAGTDLGDDPVAANRNGRVGDTTRLLTVWPNDPSAPPSGARLLRTIAFTSHPISNEPWKPMTALPDLRSDTAIGELIVPCSVKKLPSWLRELEHLHWLDIASCDDLENPKFVDEMVGLAIIENDCASEQGAESRRTTLLAAKHVSVLAFAFCANGKVGETSKLVQTGATGYPALATLDDHGVLTVTGQPSITLASPRIDWLSAVTWKQPGASIALTVTTATGPTTIEIPITPSN